MGNTRVWWEHVKEGGRFRNLDVESKKIVQPILKI